MVDNSSIYLFWYSHIKTPVTSLHVKSRHLPTLSRNNATKFIDPCTWPDWGYYDANHPIYDAWPTYGSGGFDLEAIGVLQPQQYGGDINLDGVVDYEDLEIFTQCWLSHFGQDNYLSRCDLAAPKDLIVNFNDFAVFANDWHKVEQWRGN